MTKLILIRHGETDYSLERRYCGFSDPDLNRTGIQQCNKLSLILRNIKVDKVYSSDLKRAIQSAKLIFKRFPIKRSANLREINFGALEGLKYEDVILRYPKLYENWLSGPFKIRFPKGESLKELNERVMNKLSFVISKNKNKTIALVTHGGPIRIILHNALKLNFKSFWEISPEIGTVNIVYLTV